MAEEATQQEKPKSGYTIKDGKITMYMPDGEQLIDLDYIKQEMRKAIKVVNRPNSFYVKKVREYIRELDLRGLRAVEEIQGKIKNLSTCSELGVRECCKRWVELLQMIRNFSRVKTGKQEDSLSKKYGENYDKIFKKEVTS